MFNPPQVRETSPFAIGAEECLGGQALCVSGEKQREFGLGGQRISMLITADYAFFVVILCAVFVLGFIVGAIVTLAAVFCRKPRRRRQNVQPLRKQNPPTVPIVLSLRLRGDNSELRGEHRVAMQGEGDEREMVGESLMDVADDPGVSYVEESDDEDDDPGYTLSQGSSLSQASSLDADVKRDWHMNQSHRDHPPKPTGAMAADASSIVGLRSNCQGKKKSLLIGINYFGQDGQLYGCINDVANVKKMIMSRGFLEITTHMRVLTDDNRNPANQPTRQNILEGM